MNICYSKFMNGVRGEKAQSIRRSVDWTAYKLWSCILQRQNIFLFSTRSTSALGSSQIPVT